MNSIGSSSLLESSAVALRNMTTLFLRQNTSRRTFLHTATAVPAAGLSSRTRPGAKRLAVLASRWTPDSPARQVADRFLIGYPRQGRWHRPAMDVVSAYVDQIPGADQSREHAAEFGFRIYSSVAETLRCGGERLAVDGVLMLAGQGDDSGSGPAGSDLLEPLLKVFEEDSRAVPVYWDEPLGLAQARKMVEASRQLGFPVLAGSSLPMTWRLPPLELPAGCRVEQALLVGIGSGRSDRYRALETLQAMVERRRGGETGVRSVQSVAGEAVWRAGRNGRWSPELLQAAVARSDSLQGETLKDGRPRDLVGSGELPRLVEQPEACLVDYSDGVRAAVLMLNGAVGDFTFAARLGDVSGVPSTQFLLPPEPNRAGSACLAARIEDLVQSGRSPVRPERAWIAAGILDRWMESREEGGLTLETPELTLEYRPSAESSFCGG